MGPAELTSLFEGKFLVEVDRCLRCGHSVASAVNEILGKAAWLMPHEPPTTVALRTGSSGASSSGASTTGDSPATPKRPFGGLKPARNGRLEDADGKTTAITIVEFEKQKKHLEGQLQDARTKMARLGSGNRSRFQQAPQQGYGGYGGGGGGGDQRGGDRGGDQRQRH